MPRAQQIGQILVELGYLTQEQLVQAVMEQKHTGERIGSILVRRGYITPEHLAEALAIQVGVEYVRFSIADVHPEAIAEVPPLIARKLQVLPLQEKEGRLLVAPVDIHSSETIQEVYRLIRRPISLVSANSVTVQDALRFYYPLDASEFDVCADYPYVKEFVSELLLQAIERGASAVCIEPQGNLYYAIHYRGGQGSEEVRRVSSAFARVVIHRLKKSAATQVASGQPYLTGRLCIEGVPNDILPQVSCLQTPRGERVVVRFTEDGGCDSLAAAHISEEAAQVVEQLLSPSSGLLLVSSRDVVACRSLLAAVARRRAERGDTIFSLVDLPVPDMPSFYYIPVDASSPRVMMEQLRAVVWQSPDTLIAGYVDSPEAVQTVVSTCADGVWGVLAVRAGDTVDALYQLLTAGVAPARLCAELVGVMHSDTLPRLCEGCRVEQEVTIPELGITGACAYESQGCQTCRGTGYSGTVNLYQVLTLDSNLRALLLQEADPNALRRAISPHSWSWLRSALRKKVLEGQVSPTHARLLVQAYSPADETSLDQAA